MEEGSDRIDLQVKGLSLIDFSNENDALILNSSPSPLSASRFSLHNHQSSGLYSFDTSPFSCLLCFLSPNESRSSHWPIDSCSPTLQDRLAIYLDEIIKSTAQLKGIEFLYLNESPPTESGCPFFSSQLYLISDVWALNDMFRLMFYILSAKPLNRAPTVKVPFG